MQHKKIALFGFFGWGNLGNTGTLQAFLYHLRHRLPTAEVHCICANPEEVANQFQIPVFPIDLKPQRLWEKPANRVLRFLHQLLLRAPLEILLWIKAYLFLQGFDLLLIPGTGVLDDFSVSPFQTPYDLFKWCLLAKMSHVQLSFVSVGAGPIVHTISRWFLKSALGLADYRSYRDELSQQYMESIGFRQGDNGVYPDLMFSLPLPTELGLSPEAQPEPQASTSKWVGVGVMEYYGWAAATNKSEAIYQHYLAKLGQFVLWLLEEQHSVRLLIGQVHDLRAVNDLKAYLEQVNPAALSRLVAEPIQSPEQLLQQIAATDLVVATRFHNVLCSLMLNKPVISIGYAKKNDVLMAEMGLGAYCHQIEHFEVEALQAQFRQLVDQATVVSQQIQQKNQEYRTALDEQYQILLQRI